MKEFWQCLSPLRKKELMFLLLLMVVTSFAEVLSLGAVLPFLAVMTQPDRIFDYFDNQPLLKWIDIESAQDLLLPLTTIFVAASLLAGGMRLLLLRVSTRLSFAIGADLSNLIFRTTLYQPYAIHVSRNSSEIIGAAATKVNILLYQFLVPLLLLLSSVVIILVVLLVLLSLSFSISMATFVGFGLIYGVVILVTRKRVMTSSQRIAVGSVKVIKTLQEGLGGIRDVIIDNSQEVYCQQYERAETELRGAQASSAFIAASPRFIAESIGMVFIAVLAYVMTVQDSGVANAVVVLGVLAMGAQRLLPLLQQAYSSSIQIRGNLHPVQDVLTLLKSAVAPNELILAKGTVSDLPFCHKIELCKVGFSYSSESRQVLKNINLRIPRGARLGFIGPTGSGKSTLLDIIMGLLLPTEGAVLVDDAQLTATTQNAWMKKIAHVPQSIYLFDATIAENIAFGVPIEKIDIVKVQKAAEQAQIATYIETLHDKYSTTVGERGVRLSGGQRQRIGIARALYKQAEVIIFDEATSALDNETEKAVMEAIENLSDDLTILIIAHRLTTLQNCSQIVELKNGGIHRIVNYQELGVGMQEQNMLD